MQARKFVNINNFGGKYVFNLSTQLDGVDYQYVTKWDDHDDADAFLEELAEHYPNAEIKSGEDFVNGIAHMWYSVVQIPSNETFYV